MRFVLFLLLFFVVSACSSSGKNDELSEESETVIADYKKYFSPTAFDGKTRYFVFDEETKMEGQEEIITKAIRRIEKQGESIIIAVEYTCYGDTCVRNDSTVFELKSDGVYMKESYLSGIDGKDELKDIQETVVIPWNWELDREVEYSWRFKAPNYPEMIMESKRTFTGFEELEIDGKGFVKAAIREESQVRKLGDEQRQFEVTMWDVPGIGLYRYESRREGYLYVMQFREEISEAEYNAFLGR